MVRLKEISSWEEENIADIEAIGKERRCGGYVERVRVAGDRGGGEEGG